MKFKTFRNIAAAVSLAALATPAVAQISDNGDGTFSNPLIYADVPDPDILRVGDTFYMVSTTMHMSPGCTLMKSKDLVNWEVLGYAHDQLEELDRFALKNGESEYANGSWAANLRYDKYEGLYYVIVTCNTTGKSYIFTCEDIEKGGWHRNEVEMCYDPGFLFDDTGTECKKYVVYPGDVTVDGEVTGHEVRLRELRSDGSGVVTLGEPTVIIPYANLENPSQGLLAEGAHGYKIGDYYYIFMIQGVGSQRQEIVWRSTSLEKDSFEGKLVFEGNLKDEDGNDYMAYTGIAQGGIVDTADGNWYSFLFEDYGSVGRIPVLAPMTWDDEGWPVIGNNGESMNKTYDKPVLGYEPNGIVVDDEFTNGTSRYYASDKYASDEVTAGITYEELQSMQTAGTLTDDVVAENEYGFNGSNLKVEWQWNHNPNNNLWSLTDREGYLRLKAGLLSTNIRHARNTITQRTYGPTSSAETKLEFSCMNDGDCAGITSWQCQYGFVGVKKENGTCYVIMQRAQEAGDEEGHVYASFPISQDYVYLKVDCDFTDRKDEAYFFYSLDGETWYHIGDTLYMNYDWPDFVGQRFGLFYYATETRGGCVDFDYFHVSPDLTTGYEESAPTGTLESLTIGDSEETELSMVPGGSMDLTVTANYSDGSSVDVTSSVTIDNSDASVVRISDGTLYAVDQGESELTISYDDCTLTLNITVAIFPLDAINPSIFGTGTYDKDTQTLTTSQYGFGGWEYSEPIDISDYDFIILELNEQQTCGAQLRFYDNESYWTSCATVEIGEETYVKATLADLVKDDDTALDLTSIYKVGFWSTGGNGISIKSIRLAKDTGDALDLTLINPDIFGDGEYDVDTYELTTAEYGFGGWEFSPAEDWSGYTHLVVELLEAQTCGAQIRFFDEESYWSSCATAEMGSDTYIKVTLADLVKDDETALDLTSIYKLGFWSYGGSAIKLKSVYLLPGTGSDDDTTGITSIAAEGGNKLSSSDIYTLSGMKVSGKLPAGVYIVGGKKVIVK